MATAELGRDRIMNPVDQMERTAHENDWACDRSSEDELTLIVAGTWTDYHVSINWRDDLESLHIACAFDFKVPDSRLNEIYDAENSALDPEIAHMQYRSIARKKR